MTNEEVMRLVEKHDLDEEHWTHAERAQLIAELFRARASETELRAELEKANQEREANYISLVNCRSDRDAAVERITAAEGKLRSAEAKVAEAESCYIQESSRHCDTERMLRDALLDVLSSATPHPVEHPTMWRTWRRANTVLARDPDTHVIPTVDKELEQRLMSGGRP